MSGKVALCCFFQVKKCFSAANKLNLGRLEITHNIQRLFEEYGLQQTQQQPEIFTIINFTVLTKNRKILTVRTPIVDQTLVQDLLLKI